MLYIYIKKVAYGGSVLDGDKDEAGALALSPFKAAAFKLEDTSQDIDSSK